MPSAQAPIMLDTRQDVRVVDADGEPIAVLPLAAERPVGVAVDLAWIRDMHYTHYRGESLHSWREKYAAATQVETQSDVEALVLWPIVLLDRLDPPALKRLLAQVQKRSAARDICRRIALRDLRASFRVYRGVPTTILQYPELVALIDGVPFRFPEAYFIGDMEKIARGGTLPRNPDGFRNFDGLPTLWVGQRCELCGGDNAETRHIIGPSRIVRCRDCGLEYDNPQAVVHPGHLDKYASDVHDQRKSATAVVRAEQSAQILLDGLKTIGPELIGRPLLDVGCASGELLYLLREKHHWSNDALCGVEPSRRSAEIAAAQYGLHVTSLDPAELQFADGQFSIITIVNTMEHLRNPRSVLAWAHRLLAPNGCVLIATVPNVSCFDAFCFPEGFIAKNFPDGQHHFQFTPVTLSKLCAAEGFKTVRLDGETRESVQGKISETAIWLAYNCGVSLETCRDRRKMLAEFKTIVTQKHKEIARQQGSEYQFTWLDGDFNSPEALVAFWRREIWPSPYLSDEFDLWMRK